MQMVELMVALLVLVVLVTALVLVMELLEMAVMVAMGMQRLTSQGGCKDKAACSRLRLFMSC